MAALVEFETLPELFLKLEAKYRGQGRTVLTYKESPSKDWSHISWDWLGRRVRSVAAFLYDLGIRKGDRVAILSENRPEWAIVDMATQLLGAVNVSLFTSLPASQVAFILHDSGARVFFVSAGIQLRKAEEIFDQCPALERVITMSEMRKQHPSWVQHWDDAEKTGESKFPDYQDNIRELTEGVEPDDLAALIYTSGTTGTPKGAMLTHRNFCSNASSALQTMPFGPDDHHLSFLPLCHVFERTAGYTAVLAAGARISYAESINTVNRNLPELQPTVLISVPRLFERMYNLITKSVSEGSDLKKRIFEWARRTGHRVIETSDPGPLLRAKRAVAHQLVFKKLHDRLGGNLRFAVSGGAALPKDIGRFFHAAGITIIEGYGLTETAPVLTVNPPDDPRYGTVGQVISGVTVGIQNLDSGEIIVSVSGEDYPSNVSSAEGEILVKGPNVMKGYWNNAKATDEAIDEDGWFHTGDIGCFEDGRLRITDRLKHMIVSAGGKNVYPGPIEDQFKSFPFIDQIIVVGEGREFLGALVVPDEDALTEWARQESIAFKDTADLYERDEVKNLFSQEFKSYSRQSASHEKIREFRIVEQPFSVEQGTMTPTLKLRRRNIEDLYTDLIDSMYSHVV